MNETNQMNHINPSRQSHQVLGLQRRDPDGRALRFLMNLAAILRGSSEIWEMKAGIGEVLLQHRKLTLWQKATEPDSSACLFGFSRLFG